MKVLIATDLLISILLQKDYVDGMDILFMWLKKLKFTWYMDLSSLIILTHFSEVQNLSIFNDFQLLKEIPPQTDNIIRLRNYYSHITQESVKGGLKALLPNLAWLDNGNVDFLITENPVLFDMARHIKIDNRVYSIENFLEKCAIEHRSLDPTKGVVVTEEKMKDLSLEDKFFQSFINDYSPYYFSWFIKKASDKVYVSKDLKGKVKAILKLKMEYNNENYLNIRPTFVPAKRMKISSFKVEYTGQKVGERFMRIIISCALKEKVDEIYVTIFNNSQQKMRLVGLLSDYGFYYHGVKDMNEEVYVKKMRPFRTLSVRNNFPFIRYANSAFLVPIHHEYSKDLLPHVDANLDREDIEPFKHSIKKVITLYGDDYRIQEGTVLLFYNMTKEKKERGIIAIGVVENTYRDIDTEQQYVLRCRKRSILDDKRLQSCWERRDKDKKLVVADFLYNFSFNDKAISEDRIKQCKIDLTGIHHQTPFYITKEQYKDLIKGTEYEQDIDFD